MTTFSALLELVAISLVAITFFLLIPGLGAFRVRAQWRYFRTTLIEVSRFPLLSSHDLISAGTSFVGTYRFFGALEAIQGKDLVWLSDGNLSVAADLKDVWIFILSEDEPRSVPWSRIFSLPEGTNMLVAGELFSRDGRKVFARQGKRPLLVVIYEGDRRSIMRRATSGGRQRNEYWNQLTVPSLFAGSFVLILISYVLLRGARGSTLAALLALTASLTPIAPYLPPAFPLFFLSRRYWKRARMLRAERDLLQLPLRYLQQPIGGSQARLDSALPDGSTYSAFRATVATREPLVVVAAGRTARIHGEARWGGSPVSLNEGDPLYVFGSWQESGTRVRIVPPRDPMAELTLVPGNPETLSRTCQTRAYRYLVLSTSLIIAELAVNYLTVFILMSLVIR